MLTSDPTDDMKHAEIAFVALGANIGQREQQLHSAIKMLHTFAGVHVLACSEVYETPPFGVLDQPPFLNMVIAVRTTRDAHSFFECMMETEKQLGRTRELHWGPRTIDLDLLWFGDQTINSEHLTVPHPHLYTRAFVLVPLMDLIHQYAPQRAALVDQALRVQSDKGDIKKWTTIEWPTESAHFAN